MAGEYFVLIGATLGGLISLATIKLQQHYAVKSTRKEIVRQKLEEMYYSSCEVEDYTNEVVRLLKDQKDKVDLSPEFFKVDRAKSNLVELIGKAYVPELEKPTGIFVYQYKHYIRIAHEICYLINQKKSEEHHFDNLMDSLKELSANGRSLRHNLGRHPACVQSNGQG